MRKFSFENNLKLFLGSQLISTQLSQRACSSLGDWLRGYGDGIVGYDVREDPITFRCRNVLQKEVFQMSFKKKLRYDGHMVVD